MRTTSTPTVIMGLGLAATLMACAPVDEAGTGAAVAPVAVEALRLGPGATSSWNHAAPGGDPLVGGAAPVIGAGAVDTTTGSIPDGQMVSAFDVANPVIGLLDPLLRRAIQDASTSASAAGVELMLTSGWRSAGFQQRLFDEAVTTYGSADVARQFVASPEASNHVVGRAVDVGPVEADDWLIRNGPRFGLCQIYANEIWHFELAVDARGACPPLRPNAAG